jgi:hypothetical protein
VWSGLIEMRKLLIFLLSLLIHLAAIAVFLSSIVKPFFLPVSIAVPFLLSVILVIAAVHAARFEPKHMGAFLLGLSLALALLLALLTFVDWVGGSSPYRPLTLSSFTSYVRHIRPTTAVIVSLVSLLFLAVGASVLGHRLGLWWRLRGSTGSEHERSQ